MARFCGGKALFCFHPPPPLRFLKKILGDLPNFLGEKNCCHFFSRFHAMEFMSAGELFSFADHWGGWCICQGDEVSQLFPIPLANTEPLFMTEMKLYVCS